MSLFFFISAYFSPASLDRKGPRAFLADKFRRLGLPFLFYFFVVGPALTALNNAAFIGRPVGYEPNAGPAWFLCWLLVFNVAYVAVVEGSVVMANRPSLLWLAAAAAGLGVIQFIQMIFMPLYFFMPITFGSLPFDAVFFAAGIAARRNGWLVDPLPASDVKAARAIAFVFIGSLFMCLVSISRSGAGLALLNTNACDDAPDRGATALALLPLLVIAVTGGVYAVAMSIAVLDLFRERFNFVTPWSAWLADQSYAVYLLHASVVLPLTGLFILTVRAVDGEGSVRTWVDGDGHAIYDSPSCIGDGGSLPLVLGFITESCATLVLVYPLAAAVRAIPGMKTIL